MAEPSRILDTVAARSDLWWPNYNAVMRRADTACDKTVKQGTHPQSSCGVTTCAGAVNESAAFLGLIPLTRSRQRRSASFGHSGLTAAARAFAMQKDFSFANPSLRHSDPGASTVSACGARVARLWF
jgi:hypothetical protein